MGDVRVVEDQILEEEVVVVVVERKDDWLCELYLRSLLREVLDTLNGRVASGDEDVGEPRFGVGP